MGRWFGYRIGYEDLWRVYCPKQLVFYLDNFRMLWKKQEEVLNKWQKIESPVQFAFEIPCSTGGTLLQKAKGKIWVL